jgi:hypothetical protein
MRMNGCDYSSERIARLTNGQSTFDRPAPRLRIGAGIHEPVLWVAAPLAWLWLGLDLSGGVHVHIKIGHESWI